MTKAAELAKMGEVLTNSQIGGRRNIVINGAMQVAERRTSKTGITSGGFYTVDRFRFGTNGRDEGVYTNAQVSDAPSGFSSSFKVTTTTAESAIDADDLIWVEQRFEGQDIKQLKNGSSDAEKVTLSFYVKSSITGTFGVTLYKPENTFRIINATYTINSADTWEQKVITFDGDTSGGGIDNDNTEALRVVWHLASGSTYDSTNSTSWADYSTSNWAGGHAQDGVITTTNATWQLTGVQLEVGEQATPFEHRSFGEELALCERYFQKHFGTTDGTHYTVFPVNRWGANTGFTTIQLRKIMRAEPSMSVLSKDGSAASDPVGNVAGNGNNDNFNSGNMTLQQAHDGTTTITIGLDYNPDGNYAHVGYFGNGERLDFDAEL